MVLNEQCPCKRVKCVRYGDCAACREHHKESKIDTACDRLAKKKERQEKRKE